MTRIHSIAAALFAAAAAAALPLFAQQSAPTAAPRVMEGVSAEDIKTVTAKVEAIDLTNRTVTLKGQMGRVVTLKVDPSVKNFAQVKVGDQLTLKYKEALTIKLEKSTVERSASVTSTGPITAAPGSKPGIAAEQQTVIIASVEALDPQTQEVLLKGPLDGYAEVKVKDPAMFKKVQVGDKVKFTYTEAVVLDVSTPGAAKK